MKFSVKHRVRATPPTVVWYTEAHDEVNRTRNTCKIRQLDVCTLLHNEGEGGLSETDGPGFIPEVRPDHTNPRHGNVP